MFLWNTGGKPGVANNLLGIGIANQLGTPIAFLYDIPNQPLFGGLKEDALIAETYVRFLDSKDPTWPLLLPMVKSVVKSMDALQAYAKEEWKQEIKSFIIAGASKRGWTSYLTGASGDPRVKAIAPLVIDTLNMPKQMAHQFEAFGGKFSSQIDDYVNRKLVPMPDTPEARKLETIVDPWIYRNKLTMPKMIINGLNDEYWTTDALNIYWDDLKGEKYVLYVPNAGHGLEETTAEGKKNHDRVAATLVGFTKHIVSGKPMPKMTWKHENAKDGPCVTVNCDSVPKAARLWVAEAPTQDFRKAKWSEKPASISKGTVTGTTSPPQKGYKALLAECEFEIDGLRYYLSTQLRLISATDPPDPVPESRYEWRKKHDPNGIGKFYMGREIAHVMGHAAASWLERPEREEEEQPKKLIESLKLQPGMVVADIGAGSGFYSFRIAPLLGDKGKMLAVDIQKEMLDIIRERMKKEKITNIEPVEGKVDDPKLPDGGVDLILMVDVYHEFEQPYEMTEKMVKALKPGGRLVFVEFRLEDDKVPIKLVHKMTEKQVIKEMEAFPTMKYSRTIGVLPWQHVIVFEKKK